MATTTAMKFPAQSVQRLKLSLLVEPSPIVPIIRDLRAKYDTGPIPSSRRGNSFSPGQNICIPIFHKLPSKDYDLYRLSLSRIVQERARFPIHVVGPFATQSTVMKTIGFNIESPELINIRDKLAASFQEFLEWVKERERLSPNFSSNNNVYFHPKIMFLPGLSADRSTEILEELRKIYPPKHVVATATALGFEIRELRFGDDEAVEASKEFLFER